MQLTDEELDVLFDLECQKPCTEEETKKFLEDIERLLPELTDEELDVLFDLECQKPCTEEETKKFLEDFERLLPEMCETIPKFFPERIR